MLIVLLWEMQLVMSKPRLTKLLVLRLAWQLEWKCDADGDVIGVEVGAAVMVLLWEIQSVISLGRRGYCNGRCGC